MKGPGAGATSQMATAPAPVPNLNRAQLLIFNLSSGSVGLDYFHKNSERKTSFVIQLLSSALDWFSYLVISLIKIFEFTTFRLLYQAWGVRTTCRE